MIEVIFVDFAKFASKRKITPECLAERFAGKIDRPGEFFDRVFKGQYAAVIIPYRSVVAFYSSELKMRLVVSECARAVAASRYSIAKNGLADRVVRERRGEGWRDERAFRVPRR